MASNLLFAADTVRQAASIDPPTKERGSQTRLSQITPNTGLTVGLLQEQEYSPAWRWPQTWRTVDLMRSDSQVEALFTAISLSVRRRGWMLEPNGADSAAVEAIAYDLGLPVRGDKPGPTRGRQRDKFSWDAHLQHALIGLLYGFYDFEIVGHIDDQGAWRLDKLAPRPPRTVMYASVDEFGELASVTQLTGRDREPAPTLDAGALVHYCWDREGANWYGRSVLRAIYREFDIKDRLIKVDAVKHERNGMGVPVAQVTDQAAGGDALKKAQQVASQWRAGETSSAGMPYGVEMRLLGVQGTLPDTLASIKEHNEAMARRFHAMFMMLGSTKTGSRAVGQVQKDFFAEIVDTYADWIADTATQQLVERWVQWNIGPDARAPRLISERDLTDTTELAVQDVINAVQVGALQPYPGLQRYFIERYGLPEPDDQGDEPATPPPALPAPTDKPAAARGALAAASVGDVRLPDRPLRREPNSQEAIAAVDFQAIEQAYVDAVDELTAGLDTLRASQIADLVAQVKAAGDNLEQLAQITVDPVGAEQIAASMRAIAASGAADALQEAKHQGLDVQLVDLGALEDEIVARADAVAQTLAADVSNTAARAAVRLTGATGLEGDLASSVETYLGSLKWQLATDAAKGVLQGSQNAGRFGQFAEAEAAATDVRYYHSALLDQNTCGPCADQDGQEYVDLQDVEASFAGSGGYALCEGAERCRCTAVLVAGEAAPTMQ